MKSKFWPIVLSTVQDDPELRSGQTTLLEVIRVAKRLGVDGVELRVVFWKDKTTDLPTCQRRARELGLTLTYSMRSAVAAGESPTDFVGSAIAAGFSQSESDPSSESIR